MTSGPQAAAEPNRWAALALLSVAQLMVVLDATIVNIALPSAQKALHFSTSDREWIVTAYALAFGSLLLLGGKLGDLFGRKWTFITGLVGFAIVSAIGGLATSFLTLVSARALQGAFGALLAPSALGLLTVTFEGSPDRNKAFGIFGAIAGGGASLGLLLGGILTQLLSWRWCLYVNLVIAVPTAIFALRLLVNHRAPEREGIDIPGLLTGSLGLFALVYGFSNAEAHSWTATTTIIALAAAPVLLTSFVLIERRSSHPLLPLHIVRDRSRGGAYLSILLAAAGIFGVFFFLTFFMQLNLHFSPITSGLAFLPVDRRARARLYYRADTDPAAHRAQAARSYGDGAGGGGDVSVHAPDSHQHLRRKRPSRASWSSAWGWASSSRRRLGRPPLGSRPRRQASPPRWSMRASRSADRSGSRC